jgi:type IV secretion system protein VirD4
VMSNKIRYFKEGAFKDRLLPAVVSPSLPLQGATPAGSVAHTMEPPGQTRANEASAEDLGEGMPRFSSLNMNASERNAASILDAAAAVERQEARHREAQPEIPREYSGLAGLQSELDGATNRTAHDRSGTH